MQGYVVDANVVIASLIPENKSSVCWEYVRDAIDNKIVLYSPDYAQIEIANVLWKYFERKMLSGDDIKTIWENLLSLPIQWISYLELLPTTMEISTKYHITVYDALYVMTAMKLRCPLITQDRELSSAIHNTAITITLL